MLQWKVCILVLFALLCSPLSANTDSINADLVNSKVKKSIDLTTHLPKITSSITLENTGKSAVKSFLYSADPSLANSVAFVGATVSPGFPLLRSAYCFLSWDTVPDCPVKLSIQYYSNHVMWIYVSLECQNFLFPVERFWWRRYEIAS